MSTTNPSDGSEDVTDFLRRVRDLGDNKEDMERSRNLEEEIAEGRKQREARRAERARSLSPEKQSPAGTPRSLRSPRNPGSPTIGEKPSLSLAEVSSSSTPNAKPLEATTPSRGMTGKDTDNNPDSVLENHERSHRPSSPLKGWASPNSSPRRSGTLSWQQRPTSLRGTAHAEFTSSSQGKETLAGTEESKPGPDEEPTREAIAKSLASKDPTWFRQTADRGVGSAAYRKSNEDATAGLGSSSERMKLPGLSIESRLDTTPTTTTNIKQSVSTPSPVLQATSGRLDSTPKAVLEPSAISSTTLGRESQALSHAKNTRRSPPDEKPDRSSFTSLQKCQSSPRWLARSPSPTKGVGGFVQSAMLSRSNSVTKRWSATSSTQHVRPGSAHDAPTSLDSPSVSTTTPQHLEVGTGKDAPILRDADRSNLDASPIGGTLPNTEANQRDVNNESVGAPSQPSNSTIFADGTNTNGHKRADSATPSSPSKRWSPTKSSWLESALAKPDSPKPNPPAPKPSQPAWLKELNKNRQQHGNQGSVDKIFQEDNLEEPKKYNRQKVMTEGDDYVPRKASIVLPPTSAKPSALSARALGNETTTTDVGDSDKASNANQSTQPSKSASPETKPTRKPPGATPPKPDFGAGLRSRQNTMEQKQPENLEFQKAFGNLRRTTTEKYVAPNEFKDNITRGKAALAVTGGPQTSVRKDDFRESLISQRGSMKSKAQQQGSSIDLDKPSAEMVKPSEPEAVTKRRALGRNQSNGNIQNGLPERRDVAIPEAGVTRSPENGIDAENSLPKESKAQVKTPPINSKLADRFNPGLASILAKGHPSSNSGVGTTSSAAASSSTDMSTRSTTYEETDKTAQGQLQHLTKSRARGPKRRLPRNEVAVETTEQKTTPAVRPAATADSPPLKTVHKLENDENRTPPKPTGLDTGTLSNATKLKPIVSTKSPSLTHDIQTPPRKEFEEPIDSVRESPSSRSAKPARPSKPSAVAASSPSQVVRSTPGPAKATQQAKSVLTSTAVSPVRSAMSQWETKSETSGFGALGPRAAIKLPAKQEETTEMNDDHMNIGSKPVSAKYRGLGVTSSVTHPDRSSVQSTRTGSERDLSKTLLSGATEGTASPKSSSNSPSSQMSEAVQLFADFFDEAPVSCQALEVDTQAILGTKHEQGEKIKTIRKRISEINGDGKIVPVPSNQEHVLFSSNMYLCTHTFSDSKRSSVIETYLWVGSGVTDSTLEDAQLFSKNAARQAGGPLVIFRQGKEPARFFEALGGICITRTGTSSDPSRQFLLCGRQHLGHITFDEVEFSLSAFSSAFPYIVSSSKYAELFVWKGRGCNAEELGCARLISMDLGSDREVIEIEEGQETPDFLSIFPASSNKAMPRSAEFWKQKSHLSNYNARLFLLDKEGSIPPQSTSGAGMVSQAAAMWQSIRRPSTPNDAEVGQVQVAEIAPFCQTDLEPSKIYILDTFFEIYVLIGSQAQSKSRAFSAALLFAQDYGILAASTEDRPFIPVSTVVLEGAPRDMRAAFRKWDASLVRTGSLMSSRDSRTGSGRTEKRGKGLKVVPLSVALAAISPSN